MRTVEQAKWDFVQQWNYGDTILNSGVTEKMSIVSPELGRHLFPVTQKLKPVFHLFGFKGKPEFHESF